MRKYSLEKPIKKIELSIILTQILLQRELMNKETNVFKYRKAMATGGLMEC